MKLSAIHIDSKILGGTPVFSGTRVPVETLFDYLEEDMKMEDFLNDYPSVKKTQCVKVLELAGKIISDKNFKTKYESTS